MPLSQIISIVANFILGSGIIGILVFYRAKRRTANAEATSAEVNAQGGLLGQYEAFIDSLTEENKTLKEEIRAERSDAREARKHEAEERERVVTAFKERSDALIEREIIRGQLTLAQYNKCEVVRCNRRIPSRPELPTSNQADQ